MFPCLRNKDFMLLHSFFFQYFMSLFFLHFPSISWLIYTKTHSIILLTIVLVDYAFSMSVNHVLSQSLSFYVFLAPALNYLHHLYQCFWRMIKIKTATPEALHHLTSYKLYRHLSSCQDSCLKVLKQSGRWKTNIVYQASFNLGKKAHQLLPLGCLYLLRVWHQKCLQCCWSSLIVWYVVLSGNVVVPSTWTLATVSLRRQFVEGLFCRGCVAHCLRCWTLLV